MAMSTQLFTSFNPMSCAKRNCVPNAVSKFQRSDVGQRSWHLQPLRRQRVCAGGKAVDDGPKRAQKTKRLKQKGSRGVTPEAGLVRPRDLVGHPLRGGSGAALRAGAHLLGGRCTCVDGLRSINSWQVLDMMRAPCVRGGTWKGWIRFSPMSSCFGSCHLKTGRGCAMDAVCVKVAELRAEGYSNLEDWLAGEKNLYAARFKGSIDLLDTRALGRG